MTPLNAILGSHADVILILAVVAAALLAATAGVLDFMSGTSRVLSPFAFERQRLTIFVIIGLPAAFLLLTAGAFLGSMQSGTVRAATGNQVWLWLANAAFIVVALAGGLCSPLARHWGLGLIGFAVGLGAVFPLLILISALGFDEAGMLTGAVDQVVFGIAVGLILFAAGVCTASLLAMVAYISERMALLLDSRHHLPLPENVETPAATRPVGRRQPGSP